MNGYLDRTSALIEQAAAGLSEEQLAWRPAENKWSSAEIFEHLALAFGGTHKGFLRVLEGDTPALRACTVRERIVTGIVVEMGYMPGGRKSPERALPRGLPPAEALAAIRENLAQMQKSLSAAKERFGGKARVLEHPVLGPLTNEQWEKFHFVHTRHHIKQVWERRKAIK